MSEVCCCKKAECKTNKIQRPLFAVDRCGGFLYATLAKMDEKSYAGQAASLFNGSNDLLSLSQESQSNCGFNLCFYAAFHLNSRNSIMTARLCPAGAGLCSEPASIPGFRLTTQ